MAYFAKIVNGTVESIIKVENSNLLDQNNVEQENLGLAFIASLGLEGTWVQTSFNSTFRKKYANIGGTYDAVNDVFITLQPYPSWTLDSNHDWQPPTPMPSDASETKRYAWSEPNRVWIEIVEP